MAIFPAFFSTSSGVSCARTRAGTSPESGALVLGTLLMETAPLVRLCRAPYPHIHSLFCFTVPCLENLYGGSFPLTTDAVGWHPTRQLLTCYLTTLRQRPVFTPPYLARPRNYISPLQDLPSLSLLPRWDQLVVLGRGFLVPRFLRLAMTASRGSLRATHPSTRK